MENIALLSQRKTNFKDTDRLYVSIDKDFKFFLSRVADLEGNSHDVSLSAYRWHLHLPEWKEVVGQADRLIQFPVSPFLAEIVKGMWGEDRIKFVSEEAKLWFETKYLEAVNRERLATLQADFKINGNVPADNGYVDNEKLPLRKHQKVARHLIANNKNYALFAKQGTGKTAPAISFICNEAKKVEDPINVLIICPNNVMLNWQVELERFAIVPFNSELIRGTKTKRIQKFAEVFSSSNNNSRMRVAIAGYGTVVSTWEALSLIQWDVIIADESHYFRNKKTKRWHYMQKLIEKSTVRIPMTGTPISSDLRDLWTQLEWMEPACHGFSSFQNFQSFFASMDNTRSREGYEKFVAAQNLPILKEILARYCFSITKEEALPHLPKKVYRVEECEMGEEQTESYESLAKELILECKSDLDESEDKAMTINNVLTRLLRLAQITAGYAVWDGEGIAIEDRIEHFEDCPKIERHFELFNELDKTEKMITWCSFVPSIKRLMWECEQRYIPYVAYYGKIKQDDRQEAIDKFNCDPNIRLFIGNPAAGASGVNLLGYNYMSPKEEWFNTDCVRTIYYASNWSSILREQSEDRNHRDGTRRQVECIDLLVENSIDEEIFQRVLAKRQAAMELQDVQSILQSLLEKL